MVSPTTPVRYRTPDYEAPIPTPAALPYSVHEVKSDECLWKIAKKYNTTVDALVALNNIDRTKNPELKIWVGNKLKVPQQQAPKLREKKEGVQKAPTGMIRTSPESDFGNMQQGRGSTKPYTLEGKRFANLAFSIRGAQPDLTKPRFLTVGENSKGEFTSTFPGPGGQPITCHIMFSIDKNGLTVTATDPTWTLPILGARRVDISPARAHIIIADYISSTLSNDPNVTPAVLVRTFPSLFGYQDRALSAPETPQAPSQQSKPEQVEVALFEANRKQG